MDAERATAGAVRPTGSQESRDLEDVLGKVFPESVRHAKEAEFMRLHQGGMTVSEYAMRFEHLTRFYSQALVEKEKVVEQLEGGNRGVKISEGSAGSKKGGNQRKPYDRPQPQQGGPVIRQPSGAAGGGGQGGGAALRCYRCGEPHLIRDCPHTESQCFRCQQMGHVSFNCPTRNRPERSTQRGDVQRGDAQRGDRPTTTGRVFALTAGQAESLLRDGVECCLLLAAMSVEIDRVIAEIDVVQDFAEVFPDEVPR
ncbi:uncharacterized protein LOC109788438 [Cajanus cajan]|uniref:uncharacterized protein LOC109788438 n=1 Tax=Cajanus cajan TaxID=3821 RepID=UPI00098DCF05|nr:uncharacterized protein LOC109788438 [Cajanus cajan]